MDVLEHRVAVVTGAASGIGRALAQRFAAEEMRLVLADIDGSALADVERSLRSVAPEVLAVPTDVSQRESVERLADAAFDAFGAVHILCNNAGVIGTSAPAWEATEADWQWTLGVNLWGVIHGVRAFVPRMIAGGEDGHVVNTASIGGLMSGGGVTAYSVSKYGVVALSEAMYAELTASGLPIGVSVLCPGLVQTQIFEAVRNRPPELRNDSAPNEFVGPTADYLRAALPEGMPPEDVAEQVLQAIRDRRLYVLTHEESLEGIRTRMENILAGRNPSPPEVG